MQPTEHPYSSAANPFLLSKLARPSFPLTYCNSEAFLVSGSLCVKPTKGPPPVHEQSNSHYCLVSHTQSTSEIAFEEGGGGAEPGSGCLLGLATGILLWIDTACQHFDPTISLKIRFVSTFLLVFFSL